MEKERQSMKNIETNIVDFDIWKDTDQAVCVAVCSGGMDSTSMGLAMMEEGHDVIFCHVNLGQKAETPEKNAVKKIVEEVNGMIKDFGPLRAYYFIVDTPWLGEMGGSCLTSASYDVPKGMMSIEESFKITDNLDNPGLWTPGRNIVLLSVASALADRIHAEVVTLGANQSETAYRDNTMDFLRAFELMARFGTLQMPVFTAPLYELNKPEILKWAIDHGYYDVLKHTWSCDEGFEIPCGECGCCMNRRLSFLILNEILGYKQYPDNQTYKNPHYFKEEFLPDAIQRFIPGLWYGKYLEQLRKLDDSGNEK